MKNILASEAQNKVLSSKCNFKFVSCAAGSGQSFLAAMLARQAQEDIAVIVPDVRQLLMSGADEHIKRVLLPYDYRCIEQSKNRHTYISGTGKVVYFAELSELPRLRVNEVVLERSQQLPRDFLQRISSISKVTVLSNVTYDDTHPCRKIALKALLEGKRWMVVENGFPYLASEQRSLVDVCGRQGREVETFRLHLQDNKFLLAAQPAYADMIAAQPYKARMAYQGIWNTED